jgi:hypothetical protein
MAQLRIIRAIRIKPSLVNLVRLADSTITTELDNEIQVILDSIDSDLQEAFRLGQQYPETRQHES